MAKLRGVLARKCRKLVKSVNMLTKKMYHFLLRIYTLLLRKTSG